MKKSVLLEKKGYVGYIILNNPSKLNALNYKVAKELDVILKEIKKSSLRVIVVKGNGSSFCSGGDVEWEQSLHGMSKSEAKRQLSFIQKTLASLEELPQAVIAIVQGYTVGGGSELAMACDIRIGLPSAKFSHPEIKLGLVPPLGGTQRLARVIGLGRAKYLLFTGEVINSSTALEWGLLDFVVAEKEIVSFLEKLTSTISSYSPKALSITKSIVNDTAHADLLNDDEINGYFKVSGSDFNKKAIKKFFSRRK